jgi:hypothetical protein
VAGLTGMVGWSRAATEHPCGDAGRLDMAQPTVDSWRASDGRRRRQRRLGGGGGRQVKGDDPATSFEFATLIPIQYKSQVLLLYTYVNIINI